MNDEIFVVERLYTLSELPQLLVDRLFKAHIAPSQQPLLEDDKVKALEEPMSGALYRHDGSTIWDCWDFWESALVDRYYCYEARTIDRLAEACRDDVVGHMRIRGETYDETVDRLRSQGEYFDPDGGLINLNWPNIRAVDFSELKDST